MDKLKVGYVSDAVGTAAVWSGIDGGYFKGVDLDVEALLIPDSTKLTGGLSSGELQFTNFAGPAVVHSNLTKGTDLVLIAGALNRLMQSLCARPGIDSVEALKGGTLGLRGREPDTVNTWIVEVLLPRLGFTEGEDITIVDARPKPGEKHWVTEPAVDALILHQPQPFEAAQDGWNILIELSSLDIPFQLASVAAKRSYVAENPEIAQRFVQGYAQGLVRFKEDRGFAIEVQQKWGPTEDADVCNLTWECVRDDFSSPPFPTGASIRTILEAMEGKIEGADPGKASQFVDPTYVARLVGMGVL